MNITKLPICYYPTTTILIDDNEYFLTQTSNLLRSKNLPSNAYSDPKKALGFINKKYICDPFVNRCTTLDPDRDIDNFVMLFDYRKIHREIYNQRRFKQVSVVVVDYAMPAQDGLSVCHQIQDDLSFKLLLTGEVDSSFAVEAFNEGIINKFIQKGATDLPKLLIENLLEMQYRYFISLSEAILTKVKSDLFNQSPACLSDSDFIKMFFEIMKKHNIVEYYLLDEHGSFLFLDSKGTPSWLIVKNEQDMQAITEQAEEQHANADIVEALRNRSLIPYFHTESDWSYGYDDSEVMQFLHPATKLRGKPIYYAYLQQAPYELAQENIASLDQFMMM